jgi:hypothetical protein
LYRSLDPPRIPLKKGDERVLRVFVFLTKTLNALVLAFLTETLKALVPPLLRGVRGDLRV